MSSSAYFGTGSANPFRPDGDLSKEADGIVSAVKNGTLNEVSAARRLADENDDSDGAAKDVIRRDEVSGAADDRGGDGGAMQVEVKHGVIVSSKTENVEHVMLPEKGRSCCTCSIL